jgi:hypothetical protein
MYPTSPPATAVPDGEAPQAWTRERLVQPHGGVTDGPVRAGEAHAGQHSLEG